MMDHNKLLYQQKSRNLMDPDHLSFPIVYFRFHFYRPIEEIYAFFYEDDEFEMLIGWLLMRQHESN